jgi:lipid-binding SYLF domain-containing protein
MKTVARTILAAILLAGSAASFADEFSDTTALFRNSNQSSNYFKYSYGYALFPTIGEGGFIVAGGHGKGRVYVHGRYVGDTTMTQVSVGAQAGGQAYSQVVFFANKEAFDRFTSGNFEFSADASAVAITASADASAGTQGVNASVGTDKKNAGTKGVYHDGVAVFTIVKGGAMLQAAVGGQKFTYAPKGM